MEFLGGYKSTLYIKISSHKANKRILRKHYQNIHYLISLLEK